MRIHFTYIVLLFICCLPLSSFAQQQIIDVLYMKNGSVLKGTIVEQVPNEYILFQIDGKKEQTIKLSISEIQKITQIKEGGTISTFKSDTSSADAKNKPWDHWPKQSDFMFEAPPLLRKADFYADKPGLQGFTWFALMMSAYFTDPQTVKTSMAAFGISGGLLTKKSFFWGLGAATHTNGSSLYTNLHVDFRKISTKVGPYQWLYGLNAGYCLYWPDATPIEDEYGGGPSAGTYLGIKMNRPNLYKGYLISLGYNFRSFSYAVGSNQASTTFYSQCIEIRGGWFF